MDLRERETGPPQVTGVMLGEERVVAAGRLRPALQDVPGDDRTGQPVVVRRLPAEVRGGGPGDQGGVGDPPGDDHVGAGPQALRDAEAAEVRVRGEAAGVAGGEVVALDVGDAQGDAEAARHLPYGLGESGRIEPACVGDDPDALLVGEAQGVLHLAQEGAGVSGGGVLQPVAGQDEHGQFGEVVAGEDVEVAAGQHLAQGVGAVAVEAGEVADAQGL